MTFEEMKKQSGQASLDRLRDQVRPDIGKHKKTKLKKALGPLAGRTLLDDGVQKTHAKRLEKQFNGRWDRLSQTKALQELRFCSILDSLAYVDLKDIQDQLNRMKHRLLAVCSQVRGIEVIGAFEIEIINYEKMKRLANSEDEARKLNTLWGLLPPIERTLLKTGETSFALIHFHGIVDLKGSPEKTEQEFLKAAKHYWPDAYTVELKKLYSTYSMKKNFHNIAKYLVKGGNENLIYKIGYGYDTHDKMKRQMIKSGAASADMEFEDFENEMSLTIREIEMLGKSIYNLMNSNGSKNMKNGYLFKYGHKRK